MCGTPSAWQVARARRTASGEQHARAASGASGSIQRRSVMPTASSPRSTMRCSATAESTPPDMATAVRAPGGADGSAAIASASGLGERVEGDRGALAALRAGSPAR